MKLHICLFSASFVFCHGANAASETGWILTQRSKAFGDQYLYINANGVKCINPRRGLGWITQAPQWNITFFNDQTKLYYSLSYGNWKQKMAKQGLIPEDITWSKAGSGLIAGLKASRYTMKNSAQSSSGMKAKSGRKWLSASYWQADEINVPSSLSQLISSACGLPASNSIPLQLSYCNQAGQQLTLLTTYYEQKAEIPNTDFYLPTNYKLAKNEVDVLLSNQNRALMNELAQDLAPDKANKSGEITRSLPTRGLSLNKLPEQITLPGGKTVNKGQINKFLDNLR